MQDSITSAPEIMEEHEMDLNPSITDKQAKRASTRSFELQDTRCPDPNEVDLLARLIYQEAGCDWIPDYVILWVGSVALNRVNSDLYPDTLYEVVYQPGQYEPAITGSIERPANERCIRLAEALLTNGSLLPPNVLGQCGWPTGSGVYATYYDAVVDTTIYFCTIG